MNAKKALKIMKAVRKRGSTECKQELLRFEKGICKAASIGKAFYENDVHCEHFEFIKKYFEKKGYKTEHRWSPYDGYRGLRVWWAQEK